MANAAVYARVSIRDQELNTQRDNLLDYARDPASTSTPTTSSPTSRLGPTQIVPATVS